MKALLFAILILLALVPTPAAAASISFSLCTGSTFTMTVDGAPRTAFDIGSGCSFVDGNIVTHPTLQALVTSAIGESAPLTLNGWPQFNSGGVLVPDGPYAGVYAFYLWTLYLGGGEHTFPPIWTTWTGVFTLPTSDPITVEITQHPVAHTPEPSTLMLMGATLFTVGYIARRRRG